VLFNSKHCFVMDRDDPKKFFLVGSQDPSNKLYKLQLSGSSTAARCLTLDSAPFNSGNLVCTVFDDPSPVNHKERLWHQRLGHPNYQQLYLMSTQGLLHSLPALQSINCYCSPCRQGKQTQKSLLKAASSAATRPFQRIHTDLCGPLPVVSFSGNRYFITFIDEFMRYCWVYGLSRKSQALIYLNSFV
jgi:hypothetical protein